jgi:hypothetical protein
VCCVAARGTIIRGTCALPIATITTHPTPTTMWVFAAPDPFHTATLPQLLAAASTGPECRPPTGGGPCPRDGAPAVPGRVPNVSLSGYARRTGRIEKSPAPCGRWVWYIVPKQFDAWGRAHSPALAEGSGILNLFQQQRPLCRPMAPPRQPGARRSQHPLPGRAPGEPHILAGRTERPEQSLSRNKPPVLGTRGLFTWVPMPESGSHRGGGGAR